jgi:drug/metabolite transporter (DMT)-like permease
MTNSMSLKNDQIIYATLLIALSAVLYGFLGYIGTIILNDHLSISCMLFWRFFIAGLWLCFFVKDKTPLRIKEASTLLYMFFLGAIGYAGSSGFYFMASHYTGTGLAMVIFFSYPILIALLSWILHGTKFSLNTILILAFMILGLVLLKDSTNAHFRLIGIFFGVLAGACYAMYVIGSKKFSSLTFNHNRLALMVCFGCAFIFLCLALFYKNFSFPQTGKSWVYLLALSILCTALPIQLMLKGLKHISSMRASIISVLEPIITLLVGAALLHETLTHFQVVGVFILLLSSVLVQFQKEL